MATPTRWVTETAPGHSERYIERFRRLAAEGADLAGEARLVDAVVAPGSRILDAGCGTGRVGAELSARGHEVVGVDADQLLVAAAREDHPGPAWVVGDLTDLDVAGEPFDAAVAAGNVMIYAAAGTEGRILACISRHLRPDGVFISGFATGRSYTPAQLDRDAAAAGLVLEQRFATWDVRPWRDGAEWVVSVHRRLG